MAFMLKNDARAVLRLWVRDNPAFRYAACGRAHKGRIDPRDMKNIIFNWRHLEYLESTFPDGVTKTATWATTPVKGRNYFDNAPAVRGVTTPDVSGNTAGYNPFHDAPPPPKVAPTLPAIALDYLSLPNPDPANPGKASTWAKTFGITSPKKLADTPCYVWDHPEAPEVDPFYVWPKATAVALTQMRRGRNVAFFGEKGTGKTTLAYQIAAKLKRPITLISGDGNLEATELLGMTVPDGKGGVVWQDGQLTAAIRKPGNIICLDEPSIVRPSVLFVFQNVLQNRELTLRETGEVVKVAPGVLFIATDNTNGTGGGSRRGYTDTNRLNAATIDRFGVWLKVDFLPQMEEVRALVGRTNCSEGLANELVKCANLTRKAAERGDVSSGLGMRRLIAWAETLMDGMDAEEAFLAAILNSLPEVDQEPMRQQCSIMIDPKKVAALV